jgi:hypothetical protein
MKSQNLRKGVTRYGFIFDEENHPRNYIKCPSQNTKIRSNTAQNDVTVIVGFWQARDNSGKNRN